MKYLCYWVTQYGVKTIDKNASNEEYETNNLSSVSALFYRYSELITGYVGNKFT